MAIFELRAMRGWSKAETARRFFVSGDTTRTWLRRADDESLLRSDTPMNRFPDLVCHAVQRVKLFCPALGTAKIADKLTRAGIHIGRTPVLRILREGPAEAPEPPPDDSGSPSHIVAKYASHKWHADMTDRTGSTRLS